VFDLLRKDGAPDRMKLGTRMLLSPQRNSKHRESAGAASIYRFRER
jgi:hypothetical protein